MSHTQSWTNHHCCCSAQFSITQHLLLAKAWLRWDTLSKATSVQAASLCVHKHSLRSVSVHPIQSSAQLGQCSLHPGSSPCLGPFCVPATQIITLGWLLRPASLNINCCCCSHSWMWHSVPDTIPRGDSVSTTGGPRGPHHWVVDFSHLGGLHHRLAQPAVNPATGAKSAPEDPPCGDGLGAHAQRALLVTVLIPGQEGPATS